MLSGALAEDMQGSGLQAAARQHDALLLAALLLVCVGIAAVLLPEGAWAEAAADAAGVAGGQQEAAGDGASESAGASLLRFLLVTWTYTASNVSPQNACTIFEDQPVTALMSCHTCVVFKRQEDMQSQCGPAPLAYTAAVAKVELLPLCPIML